MRTLGILAVLLSLTVSPSVLASTFPVTVTDDRGEAITIKFEPQRVIALNALYAQILVDLGSTDRLVAICDSDDNPPEVLGLPTVGPAFSPNVELILGYEPDLVLGANDWGGERAALESAGVTVLTTPWLTSINSIFETVRTLATSLGDAEAGEALVGCIAEDVVTAETPALGLPQVRTAFLYASTSDDPPYAAGGDAIENELILRAGGANVFVDLETSPQVSFEEILQRDPDVIFTAPSQLDKILDNPLLQSVSAVVHGRVFGIRASLVSSTRVAEALRAMVIGLHGGEP